MATELTEVVRERGLPLGSLIEPGPGFRLGAGESSFILTGHEDGLWTYADEQDGLKVESRVQVLPTGLVISHRVENIAGEPSPPIDIIEPLHLVFRQPPEVWRHLFAGGGTAEHVYPPTAYRTFDCSRAPRLSVETHPLGRSSELHLPLLISLASTSADSEGLFCGLEWSGMWHFRWEGLTEGRSSLAAGIGVKGLRLEPGEALTLPDVHLGFFSGGPAAGTNALRRHLYQNVCARYRGEPMIPRVSYAHWFGIANDFTDKLLLAEAERASRLGVEVFCVDGGWYPGDFPEGVGNWRPDPRKFPRGLEPLADRVRELGMELGLWFEVERGVEGTDLVRRHPDWFVPVPGWGEGQFYHLNLARRDAQDGVIELVGALIDRYDLRWSRWDYNIEPKPLWDSLDPTGRVQFAYMEGLYRVLDTLMREHPNWMVECCASGGRRIDIGTMRRAHTCWFSDQTADPLICRWMQARANRFLPGHLCGSSVAVCVGQGDGGFDDTAAMSRMLGKLAFDGDVASWSGRLTRRMARWVEEFKAVRHLLVQDFYQLLPMPTTVEDWDAVQFAGYGGDEAALFVFAGEGGGRKTIRLRGLKEDGEYLLSRRPRKSSRRISGARLMKGLPVRLGSNEGALWHITTAE